VTNPAGAPACGCNKVASDCLPNYACNITTLQCTKLCGNPQIYTGCNGGCCPPAAAAPPSCAPGTTTTECGSDGGACSNCQQFPMMTCDTNAGVCK
jgi:hypothetical protein